MNTPNALPLLVAALLPLAGCTLAPLPSSPGATPPPAAPVATAVPLPIDPALLQPSDQAFKLGPGDKLDIEMVGDIASRSTVTVGPDGKIYYYILPGIDVWGLTLAEVRQKIGDELQRFVRERPALAVSLKSVASQQVWLLGRLNTPGVYTLSSPTTLLNAISQAGGLAASAPPGAGGAAAAMSGPEAADLSRSFVIRKGSVLPVNFERLLRQGDLGQNIYLQPDDFVFLPSAASAEVHVLGAVAMPRAQSLGGGLTVTQAVALSGGSISGAHLNNVAILRGSLSEPTVIIVPVDQVLHGRAPDVRLQAGDIVYVPSTPYRTLSRYVNLILDTFARTVGVTAGANAVSSEATSVGIGVGGGGGGGGSSGPTQSGGPAFTFPR